MNERRSLGAGHVRGAHTVVSLTSDIPRSTPYRVTGVPCSAVSKTERENILM